MPAWFLITQLRTGQIEDNRQNRGETLPGFVLSCSSSTDLIPKIPTTHPRRSYRGAGSPESASAYASTAITAAFSSRCFGSTLSNVSAAVWW